MTYRAVILFASFISMSALAQAGECVTSQTLGVWENPFAGHREDLTKLEIKEICNAHTVPHIQVKAYTACAPRDCTWGRSIAHQSNDTSLEVGYNTFFARRTVTVSINGKRMDATVYDDFHDPRKANTKRSFVLWRK
ncbi:hypothetical protein [uncultured Cohaesibacter sp.]|uniref:hypothetical protein n=1 Tax=uncultured Cohaesibacter sp. TaxID=1002546 RepID=UPI00293164C5|nr:hypothetical protein [uncultured Cohaesibacter sp.]